jgi:LysR family hydrogen peroxide-inducible transcriptional activator
LTYCRARKAPKSGATARIHFESGSFETLVRLVDSGLGGTVLPALVVHGLPSKRRDAQVRPLVAPTPVREIGFVTARAHLRGRVSRALVDLIGTHLRDALGKEPRRAVVLDPMA